jgi:hypothetical protein
MGEWSDFFEDFPEENPANWIDGVYAGANGAQSHRDHQTESMQHAPTWSRIRLDLILQSAK